MKRSECKKKSESGYVLITGLIFILVITIVSTSLMETSNLDYKIASNMVFKDLAFQSSESGRSGAGDAISYYFYEKQWDDYDAGGLTWTENYDPSSDLLGVDENLYSTDSLVVDMNYDVSGSNIETIAAGINILKSPGAQSNESGLQQLSAYEGLGKGAGAGGVYVIFEIRSTGTSASSAVATTASEYRVTP